MKTLLTAIIMATVLAAPAPAGSREQLLRSVGPELRNYVRVDPNTLSTSQLGRLHMVLYGPGSAGTKQAQVRSIVGGSNSLFGALGIQARIGISN